MLLPPEYEATRRQVQERRKALDEQGLEDDAIAQGCADIIENHERTQGSRFLKVDGTRPALFSAIPRKLFDISSNRTFNAHLFAVYGLNAKDKFTRLVTQVLESHCMHFGETRPLRRWVAWQDGVLHMSNYNGETWRITGAGVTVHPDGTVTDDCDPNGTEGAPIGVGIEPNGSSVVFADDDGGVPVDAPNVCKNGKLWKVLGSIKWAKDTAGHVPPKLQTRGMMLWMLMLAFPDMFPTKPLLLVEGAPGSGKSATLQLIQSMLHGRVKPLIISKNGERDFKVSLVRAPIAVLDNTDDFIDWMPNTVAAYTTGGEWSDRELHTNLGEVIIKPQAFIAVASKNPTSFRTEDVADRSIMMRMTRRESFVSMRQLLSETERTREQSYGHYLYLLNRIVAVLNSPYIQLPVSQHRMADFETFAWACSHALNWKPHMIEELMDGMQRERVAFASEHDIVVELLDQWCEKVDNQNRIVNLRDLFRELRTQAEYDGKVFLKTPQALSQRLRAPHLHAKFDIDDNTITNEGYRLYRISHRFQLDTVN